MLGTLVNVAAVLVGGTIGLLLKKGLPGRLEKALMTALGLCTVFLGITGLSDGKNTLVLILSMVIGTLIGELLVYQGSITLLAQWAAPLLSDAAVAEMSCVGALILIALGLNMMGLSKFKVMNFVPAIFLPIIFCLFM